jgi:hypothetical protein
LPAGPAGLPRRINRILGRTVAAAMREKAPRAGEKSAHLTASRHYMSTIEEPHKSRQWRPFRLRLFAVCKFHVSGVEGVDDLLAVSTGPSTTASRALTDNGRIVGEIGCYDVKPWEDELADDVLEKRGGRLRRDEGRRSRVEEAVMAQMIDALKATVEAEKTKLLAELSQAKEPRLSAIRKEIEACESLLQRLARSRAA